MPWRISRVLDGFLGNPFDRTAEQLQAAEAALGELDLPRVLRGLVDAGDIAMAKQLLLAVGHYQACNHPKDPSLVLSTQVASQRLLARLPRTRGAYLRVVMAAARCYHALNDVAGDSPMMRAVRRKTWAACFGDSLIHGLDLEPVIRDHDVLILGETGTGKELVARAIVLATAGDTGGNHPPHSSVNAAALPETLVESELFGHVKGAFTGATETRSGRIRTASGGCLFLDEVGDLPQTTQVKLLRVIETNEVFPLGSDDPHPVDVRYVAATHKDLQALAQQKLFRQDLYERLAGITITIPPLRERPEDIQHIGERFIQTYAAVANLAGQAEHISRWLTSREARRYQWPGNVRELQNALRNMLLGLDPGIELGPLRAASANDGADETPAAIRRGTANMREVQDWYLQKVLTLTDGNLAQTARQLGIDRTTVRRHVDRLAEGSE